MSKMKGVHFRMGRLAQLFLTFLLVMGLVGVAYAASQPAGGGQERIPNLPNNLLKKSLSLDPVPFVINTNNTLSAGQLAQSLVGEGVTVENVTSNCNPEAMGSFSITTTVEGLPLLTSGILLSSGYTASVVGPNSSTGTTGSFGTPGDADLDNLSGMTTYDACVLEFDFTPSSSAVSFQYLFGSEEYNEWVNSPYNDVFGFFINGQNCAIVNGAPVTINTINGGNPYDPSGATGSNPQYFINNDTGIFNTQLDGFTTILSCSSLVKPGIKNHIKLAIADASDSSLDSDVFIGAGTLQSLNYNFQINPIENSATANSGITTAYGIELQNTGGKSDIYSVTAVSNNGWTTVVAPTAIGPISPLDNAYVDVYVEIPKTAGAGQIDIATITFTSQGDPTKIKTAKITTTANGSTCSFDRDLPEDGYIPSIKVPVLITAVPSCVPETENFWAVADTVPTGWQVTEINEGGTFQNNMVTWQIDNNSATERLLSYKATPPAGTSGSVIFNGVGSVSGTDYPITGDFEMNLNAGLHPADKDKNNNISISEFTGYGASWKSGKLWPTGWNPIQMNFVTNAASIWKNGGAYLYDPAMGSAPSCWKVPAAGLLAVKTVSDANIATPLTAVRNMPTIYVAGEPVNVAIDVTPGATTSSYAVEDTPPSGWAVSSISNNGKFANGKVNWGPFNDNITRKLTYKTTPPLSATEVQTFSGNVAFDSSLLPISGSTTIKPATGAKVDVKVTNPKLGSISSDDGNIACTTAKTSDCTDKYYLEQQVVFTATPDPGYVFNKWTGACSKEITPVCKLTVAAKTTVGASFAKPTYFSLKVVNPLIKKASVGTITSSDGKIDCDGNKTSTCVTSKTAYMKGDNTIVTLTAVPATGYIFDKWTGGCTGTNTTCQVTMSKNQTVSAKFKK